MQYNRMVNTYHIDNSTIISFSSLCMVGICIWFCWLVLPWQHNLGHSQDGRDPRGNWYHCPSIQTEQGRDPGPRPPQVCQRQGWRPTLPLHGHSYDWPSLLPDLCQWGKMNAGVLTMQWALEFKTHHVNQLLNHANSTTFSPKFLLGNVLPNKIII